MKNCLLVIAFLFIGNFLQAQTTSNDNQPKKIEKQVGLNFTNFYLRFFADNTLEPTPPSILILYKRGSQKRKWRHGFGGNMEIGKSNVNEVTTNRFRVNYNFGREYYRQLGKQFSVYFGWESTVWGFLFKRVRKRQFDDDDVDVVRSGSLGGRALVGFQFNFNQHLSLLTETNYGLVFNYFRDNAGDESYEIETVYVPPTSLVLSYHF